MSSQRPRQRRRAWSRLGTTPGNSEVAASVALTCTIVGALTACSPGGSSASGSPTPIQRPLAAYIAWMNQDAATTLNNAIDDANRAQELIAACMAAQGFDYAPQPMSAANVTATSDPGTSEHLSMSDASTSGYGVTVTTGDGGPSPMTATADSSEPTANWRYRASLTPQEQHDFDMALFGVATGSPDADDDDASTGDEDAGEDGAGDTGPGGDDAGGSDGGCIGRSQQTVMADRDPLSDEQFADLAADIATLQESETDGPELASVNGDWLSCMQDAGFTSLASPLAGRAHFTEKLQALVDGQILDMDGPAVSALRDEEIATAVADVTCRESTSYEARRQAAVIEIENAFISSHRAELERYRDAQAQH